MSENIPNSPIFLKYIKIKIYNSTHPKILLISMSLDQFLG